MKILVIQNSKLGDMVCTTPVFRAIKKGYPECLLIVSGDKLNQDLLAGNPNVDLYIVSSNLEEHLKTLKLDVVIMTSPDPKNLWRFIKSKTKRIIVPKIVGGFSPYATKTYRLLSLLVTRVPHRMGHYAPQEYLNMLAALGINSSDTKKELFVDPSVEQRVRQRLSNLGKKPLVAIAPGAGNKVKEWPPENFHKVAKWLVEERGAQVVLVGTEKDRALADIVKKGLSEDSVLDTLGELSIEELKALIKQVDLFISADTGPIYIAEAFGVSTVDIVGPVDEREQPPQGPNHFVVLPPKRGKPELYVMNARVYDTDEVERLASSTRVEEVLNVIRKIKI